MLNDAYRLEACVGEVGIANISKLNIWRMARSSIWNQLKRNFIRFYKYQIWCQLLILYHSAYRFVIVAIEWKYITAISENVLVLEEIVILEFTRPWTILSGSYCLWSFVRFWSGLNEKYIPKRQRRKRSIFHYHHVLEHRGTILQTIYQFISIYGWSWLQRACLRWRNKIIVCKDPRGP